MIGSLLLYFYFNLHKPAITLARKYILNSKKKKTTMQFVRETCQTNSWPLLIIVTEQVIKNSLHEEEKLTNQMQLVPAKEQINNQNN